MKSFGETFTLTDELDTKEYAVKVQTKIDELIDLLNHASTHIKGAGEDDCPIWEYVIGENYTAMYAIITLVGSLDRLDVLDKNPELVGELHDLIYND